MSYPNAAPPPMGNVPVPPMPGGIPPRMPAPRMPGTPGAPPAAAGDGSAVSLQDIARMLRRHLLMIIVLSLLIGAAGTALTLYLYAEHPTYAAVAQIRVDPGSRSALGTGIPGETERVFRQQQELDNFINDQVARLTSNQVLRNALSQDLDERVIDNLEYAARERTLESSEAIRQRQALITERAPQVLETSGLDAMATNLERRLSVGAVPKTTLIQVYMSGTNRRLIADMVNCVVDSYMLAYKNERQAEASRRVQRLRQTLSDVENRLTQATRQIQTFREENADVELGGIDRTETTVLLEQLQRARAQAQMNLLNAQIMAQQVNAATDDVTVTPQMELQLQGDGSMQRLRATESALMSEREALLEHFTETHDSVRNIDRRLAEVRSQIEQRRAELIQTLKAQQQRDAQSQLAAAQANYEQINTEYGRVRNLALETAKDRIAYSQLLSEQQALAERKRLLESAIQETLIAQEVSANNVSIAHRAEEPVETDKAGPRREIFIPASFIIGIAISIGLALLVEFIDNRVRTPMEVTRSVHMPVLGTVPDQREDPLTRGVATLGRVCEAAPRSLMAESFRQLRTALMYSTDTDLKTLLVTSPRVGVGKTMTACNLAITLAQGGSRVLLIDCNFRRPMVHRTFDLPNSAGLSSVLARIETLDSAVQATATAGLEALCCGPVPPSPADLLGSEAMQRLLAQAREAYDCVVLDGAPLLIVSDAHVLSSMVDGCVLVISSIETPRGVAIRARRTLQDLRARTVGAVLNRVRATKGGYFRETYRSYYDYAATTPPAETPQPAEVEQS